MSDPRERPKKGAIQRASNPPREPYRPVLSTSRNFDDDLLELRAAAVRDVNGDSGLFRLAFEHTGRQMVLRSLMDQEIAGLGLRIMLSQDSPKAQINGPWRVAHNDDGWRVFRDAGGTHVVAGYGLEENQAIAVCDALNRVAMEAPHD
jgi:hypothetical protein